MNAGPHRHDYVDINQYFMFYTVKTHHWSKFNITMYTDLPRYKVKAININKSRVLCTQRCVLQLILYIKILFPRWFILPIVNITSSPIFYILRYACHGWESNKNSIIFVTTFPVWFIAVNYRYYFTFSTCAVGLKKMKKKKKITQLDKTISLEAVNWINTHVSLWS